MMQVMQEQIDACNAIMIFGVHGLVIQPIQVILLDYIMGAKLSTYRMPLIDRDWKVNVNVKQRHWFKQP